MGLQVDVHETGAFPGTRQDGHASTTTPSHHPTPFLPAAARHETSGQETGTVCSLC